MFGLLPRWATALSWAALAVSFIAGPMFGGLFDLLQAVMNISPFTHLPAVTADEVSATPIVTLLAVAAALTIVGLAAFRRRSLSL